MRVSPCCECLSRLAKYCTEQLLAPGLQPRQLLDDGSVSVDSTLVTFVWTFDGQLPQHNLTCIMHKATIKQLLCQKDAESAILKLQAAPNNAAEEPHAYREPSAVRQAVTKRPQRTSWTASGSIQVASWMATLRTAAQDAEDVACSSGSASISTC